jgi:hypothetical protein
MYNCERPILIFGCPRSGTSLLSRILNSHPRIGVPFESHLYAKFLPRVRRYGDLSVAANRRSLLRDMLSVLRGWEERPDLDHSLQRMRSPTLHGAVDSILYGWCVERGKSRWGEKTPRHATYWREILSGFPDAQIVHLIRDGRDVAVSWKRARFGPKHLYVAAERWRDFVAMMAAARRALPESQFFELRYEDLVANPEREIRALCGYLGEPYAPQMLSFHEDRTPYRTDERNLRNLRRPLIQSNVAKWRRNMLPKDVLIVEAAAAAALARAGYDLSNADPRVSPTKRRLYRLLHPFLRLVAMAKNTQGQRDALRDFWALSKNRLVSLRR